MTAEDRETREEIITRLRTSVMDSVDHPILEARATLHDAGEHWRVNLPNGVRFINGRPVDGPTIAPDGDGGAEGSVCVLCGQEWWYRGPGY